MKQIFATFESSIYLELAISTLKERGVSRIYAVPLDLRQRRPKLLDSLHRSDGTSFLDKGMILAFMFATVGASKGFVWTWGPVIWGLIGAAVGFLLGVAINVLQYWWRSRNSDRRRGKGITAEVILIVACEDEQADTVEGILWDHLALGLAVTR